VKITLLGTGGPLPDAHRAGPSTLVEAGGQQFLVDSGRGCVMRLAACGVPPAFINTVLLTHLHSDHICDLNDVVTTRWITSPASEPLRIVGPVGTRRVVEALLAMLALDEEYRLAHHADLRTVGGMKVDVVEVNPGDALSVAGVNVSAHRTDHRPVAPTIGYRIEHDGKVAALAGDTVPCAELDQMCSDADVYVQTVLREDMVRALGDMLPAPASGRLLDILDYHSTVEQAGQTAARNNVKHLVLTHYVPAPPVGTETEWCQPASAFFNGEIVAGPDLTSVTV